MNEFIAYMIKNLVEAPDDVQVQVFEGESSTIVEIRVAADDVAKVIGKQGRTIKALRTIAITVAARFGKKIRLELIH